MCAWIQVYKGSIPSGELRGATVESLTKTYGRVVQRKIRGFHNGEFKIQYETSSAENWVLDFTYVIEDLEKDNFNSDTMGYLELLKSKNSVFLHKREWDVGFGG